MNIYFNNFLRTEEEALGGISGFATTYFYPSLMLPVDHNKHAGDKTLWEYEQLFVPVNLPKENHWLLVVISIVKLCLFLYDSASCSKDTYKSIFSNIKNKYIKEQLKWLPSEEREFYKEENWNACFPECPKQDNDKDCGIFTCLFAKHMSRNLQDDDGINLLDEDYRGEVATDLISLVSATKGITPSIFEWMTYEEDTPLLRIKLDEEVQKAGLTYRQPPTSMDGNCLFHAISDQLDRLGLPQRSAAKLRAEVVAYLKDNPTTPDGGHLREFVRNAWDSWLRRMSTSGEWGNWIAIWGLVNMLELPVAIISSLGEYGLHFIYPSGTDHKEDISAMALLGHEAEVHYHSLEPAQEEKEKKDNDSSTTTTLVTRYGKGEITCEICPRCNNEFECYSAGVFEQDNGTLQIYADDMEYCDNCLYEMRYSNEPQ